MSSQSSQSRLYEGAAGALKRLTALPKSGLRSRGGWAGIRVATQPADDYVGVIFQALAVFRFYSFAMGAGLMFFLSPGNQLPIEHAILVAVVGVYNMARVLWRFNPGAHNALVSWVTLAGDLVLSITLVLLTDGLDSPFLIYSLAPVLTASLLMDARSAVALAAVSGLSIPGGHVAAGIGIGNFPWILSGNYLAFSLLYVGVCLVIAYLPFLANLNWHRRVRSDSVATERVRLRREVHDNVAQTLAFLSLKVKQAEERASSPSGALTARDAMEISSMVERAYLSVRDYLDEAPDAELDEPLEANLAIAAGQWSRDTGFPVQMGLAGSDGPLPTMSKRQLLQIAREALANVAKHADPTEVWLELEYEPGWVTMRIRDNGRGFSASQPRGHGLDIMKERADVIGASLTVESTPGEGTEVVVACPRGQDGSDS